MVSAGPDRPQPANHRVGQGELAELKAAGRPDDEYGFVVRHDGRPRWLDPTVDPNDRTREPVIWAILLW